MHVTAQDRPWCLLFRVYLNGTDVTGQCFDANEERGEVSLYSLNSAGKKYVIFGDGEPKVASFVARGTVELRMRPFRECAAKLWAFFRMRLEALRMRAFWPEEA